MEEKIIYKEESYKIIGICMYVHNVLSKGHNEVIYKDVVESLTNSHTKQTLNYLAASKLKLGLLFNFGEDCLK